MSGTANVYHETSSEMDCADIVSNPPVTTDSNFLPSASPIDECEMEPEESAEADMAQQLEDIREPEVIQGEPHKITVKMSSNSADKRVYDKKNYCLYCEKPYAKITRHLKQIHSDKPDVAKALAKRNRSAQQTALFTKIRNLGNYQHNCKVLSSGSGQIVPKRQAPHEAVATDYLPCSLCLGMYMKTDLWRHKKRCTLQVEGDRPVKKRRVQASSSLLLPMDATISTGLKTVLEDMTYDKITQFVKTDTLILKLGERMYLRNGENRRNRADIRNKMRELARLVLTARNTDKDIVFLKDLICPRKFNTVLEAVKRMTGFNDVTNRFSVPSTALKLRHSLVKVSHILQGEGLRQEDEDLKLKAEQFHTLIELEWTTHVSSNALKTLYQQKWNSPQVLPLSKDIKKLQDHLKGLEVLHKNNLLDKVSQKSWSELCHVTLAQLIIFNQHREGEVSAMEVSTYMQRSKHTMHDDVLESLSRFEKKLCENLIKVEIWGKRGKKVPVLFPNNIQESVELLIKTREEAGVSPTNPYIFARLSFGSQENIRGSDCLRQFARSCGAQHPNNLTSTKLRKHIATISQLLNLQTHELDQLATFMGHDINVHREYYRLPEGTLQMAKISRILFAVQDRMGQFKGMSLEDITPNINSTDDSIDLDADFQSGKTSTRTNKETSKEVNNKESKSKKATLGSTSLPLKKGKQKRPFSKMEREVTELHLKNFLEEMKVPGKEACVKCLNENPVLKDNKRTWEDLKHFVHNRITSKKRALHKQQDH